MSAPDTNLLEALRCLKAARALTEEARLLVLHDESLSPEGREEMAHYAGQNATYLGLTAAYGENRMLRGVQE